MNILFFLTALSLFSHANPVADSTTYVSAADQSLTIKKIAVLPVSDNVDGIFARVIEKELIDTVNQSHRWNLVETNFSSPISKAEDLEIYPDKVKTTLAPVFADAAISAQAIKGAKGINIKFNLFLKTDGLMLAQVTLDDHQKTDMNEIRNQTKSLYKQLLQKIPYEGMVLSRQGNRVTVNVGSEDGIVQDQILTAIQIIKVNRHPKLNFVISTEKEVIGKMRITKVDNTLSFGQIITEKERGVVQKEAKISGIDGVVYPVANDFSGESGEVINTPANNLSFGKNPKAWVPQKNPTFGMIGVMGSLGTYSAQTQLQASGTLARDTSLDAKSGMYPSLKIQGQLWLNPYWLLDAQIKQGVATADNPMSGSSPSKLSVGLNQYSLKGGYNFLIGNQFFGPKVTLLAGYSSYSMFVDNSSPQSINSIEYGGLVVGLRGSFPLTRESAWTLGAEINFLPKPGVSEKPVSSGDKSTNRINDFAFFVENRLSPSIQLIGQLNFELVSSNFSGNTTRTNGRATTFSQKSTNLAAGIQYLF